VYVGGTENNATLPALTSVI